MAKKSLVEYIEKELKRGFSKDDIRQELRKAGHDLQEMDDAFSHVKAKQKVRKINFAVLGAILIFIVVAVIVGNLSSVNTTDSKTEQKASAADQSLFDTAIMENDLSDCNKIINTVLKENCLSLLSAPEKELSTEEKADQGLFDYAILNNDIAQCDGIKSEAMKQNCKELLTPATVQKTEQEIADQNLFDEAIMQNNAAVCDGITNNALKETCKGLLS